MKGTFLRLIKINYDLAKIIYEENYNKSFPKRDDLFYQFGTERISIILKQIGKQNILRFYNDYNFSINNPVFLVFDRWNNIYVGQER